MVFTKGKMWAAAIGSTCTAIATALTTVQLVLGDGHIDVGEVSTLITTVVTLASTVYAVWRTPNKVVTPNDGQ